MTPRGLHRFAASTEAARDGIEQVVNALRQHGLGGTPLADVELVLAEVVNNIVEHAYRGREPGLVSVAYVFGASGLILTVRDRGAPFTANSLPAGHAVDLALPRHQLPEGGFGWLLIRRLTSDLSYVRRNGFNRLRLRFDVS
ncbi:ATP-binding protein [Albibacillus kandeliae]|uniref:ATP-binding protein n=1 Tax=Albibacillus kandeliae TaxID=2174228 RepID=UPI000D692310|nr:ATP-binding protein [Albibacillus kandeliae]